MDIINNYLAKKSSTNKQDKARGQDVKIKCLKAEKSKAEWVSTNLFIDNVSVFTFFKPMIYTYVQLNKMANQE